MKRSFHILMVFIFFLLFMVGCGPPKNEVYFSPNGGCRNAIIKEIGKAKKNIRVQMYIFTTDEIGKHLREAIKKKVDVKVIIDENRFNYSFYGKDPLSGIPVLVDRNHIMGCNHNKVIIIDEKTVITGSYNYTEAAETKNAENIIIIRDKAIAKKYMENWEEHASHSKPRT